MIQGILIGIAVLVEPRFAVSDDHAIKLQAIEKKIHEFEVSERESFVDLNADTFEGKALKEAFVNHVNSTGSLPKQNTRWLNPARFDEELKGGIAAREPIKRFAEGIDLIGVIEINRDYLAILKQEGREQVLGVGSYLSVNLRLGSIGKGYVDLVSIDAKGREINRQRLYINKKSNNS